MQTVTIRRENPDPRPGRRSIEVEVTEAELRDLTEAELASSIMYARLGTTDERALTLLRRESMRRAIAEQDSARAAELLRDVFGSAFASLVQDANFYSNGHVTGNSADLDFEIRFDLPSADDIGFDGLAW